MKAWKRWWAPRGHPRGLSTGVGMVGGLILFTTVLTGGIAATQIVRVHAALAQAAEVAAQSEQQNGCWTQGTTNAVYQTLKGAGINAGSVNLTADTANSTSYGGAVTAGLATKVGVSVLGAPLMQIPIAAASNSTSFYTPSTAGGANSACVKPATCPTVTTMVSKTTPGHWTTVNTTKQVCTPVSKQVCAPVTSRQCGYRSREEYTCTPVQSCTPVSKQVCSPNYYWDTHMNCYQNWTGYIWVTVCNGGWAQDGESCTTQTTTSCTTTNSCGWGWHNVYTCWNNTTSQCTTHTSQSCQTVPTTKQVWVPSTTTSTPVTTSVCG